MPTSNPVPSSDPSDLVFNAEKLDQAVNSTDATFTDRLGVSRRTLASLEAEFPGAQAAMVSAAESAGAAAASEAQAEAARDSINATGRVYSTAAAGVDPVTGVANGQSFAVVDASGNYWITYKNNAGAALEIARSYTKSYQDQWLGQPFESLDPVLNKTAVLLDTDGRILMQSPDPALSELQSTTMTTEAFETIDPAVSSDEIWIVDSDQRIIARAATPASVQSVAQSVANLGTPAGVEFFETLEQGSPLRLLDEAGRVLAEASTVSPTPQELIDARGSAESLAERLNRGSYQSGDPRTAIAQPWVMRESRFRIGKRRVGESAQLVIALIGDSYTQNASRYSQAFTKLMQDTFGNAGIGWVSFAWFGTASGTWSSGTQPTGKDLAARSDLMSVHQVIGTWTCTYNSASLNTPSLSTTVSSTPDDYLRFTVPAGHNAATLFYAGGGTGVVQVSWDDGSTWSANIALNSVGASNVALSGVPATAAIARIKVISGTVSIAGVDLKSAADGVRVHKLGGSGSSALQWSSVTPATWGAQMVSLGSHAHQVFHGTNDQSSGPTPAVFASRLQTIVANLNSVLPYSDRVIAMPAENQRTTNTVAMAAMSEAARDMAANNDCAFIDMQPFFGSTNNFAFEYSWANTARQWYASDLIHPVPETGGRVMVDAFFRLYSQSI